MDNLHLLARLERPKGKVDVVLAIGTITNVASALLADPGITEKIVIVWLGGHAPQRPDTFEFNMLQDVAAARIVFSSGAALVQRRRFTSAFHSSGMAHRQE